MTPKAKIKIIIDVLMTVGLLLVSGYQFWGDAAHEWAGAAMLALFIAHHILNAGWYKSVFKGKYTAARIFQLIVNLLLLLAMAAQMYSGIVMSRHVFVFLPIEGGMMLARLLHILGAYWGLLLMGLHIGLHWGMILGMLRRIGGNKTPSKMGAAVCRTAGALIACYGIYAFIKRDFLTYMFLKSEFVFMDYAEPPVLFYLDYIALIGLCIFIAHYLQKLLKHRPKEAVK